MTTNHGAAHSTMTGRAIGGFMRLACAFATIAATSGCSSSGSSPAAVAPAIMTQPAPATVADGGVGSFSVVATGDAPLAYQWRRNGVDLVDGAGVVGAATAGLALTAPIAFDNSQLSVLVSNGAGSVVSADAKLTVSATSAAPVITMQPSDATVMAGTTATFTVAIAGGMAPVSYQWKRNGVAVAGATSATYTTAATVTADSGTKYSVDVVNPLVTLGSNAALLTVIAGSGSWGPVVSISGGDLASALNADSPAVAIDATGVAVAAWQQASGTRNAVWGNSADASGKWATAATIDRPTGGNALSPPRIVMTPGGTGIAVFAQPTTGTVAVGESLVGARFTGGTWGAAQTLVNGDVDTISEWEVGIAANGSAAATFIQPDATMRRVRAARSSSANVWGPPVIVDVAGGDIPKLTVAANGHATAVWVRNVSPIVSQIWSSRDVGAGWTAASMVTTDTSPSPGIDVTSDAAGNVTAIWAQPGGASGYYVVRAARLDDVTGAWSTPTTLSDGTRNASFAKPSVNTNGDAVVVWYEDNSGLYASNYTAATATWSPRVFLPGTLAPTFPTQESTAIDDSGNAMAIWLQFVGGGPQRVFYSRFVAGLGTWTTPATLMTDPNAYSSSAPAIALDAKGFATAVWHQRIESPLTAAIVARTYR